MTRLSVLCACAVVVAALVSMSGRANAQELGGINDRYLHFSSLEKSEGWERHEGAWEEEGEFERRAVRWLDLAPLRTDAEVWMDNVHPHPGDGRTIPNIDLFAKRPGAAEEQEITQVRKLPKGTSLRIKMVQPHQWTLTQHAYWPSLSRIRVYARPADVRHTMVGRITWTRGDVYVETADGQRHTARPGTELVAGDVILTGAGAMAELVLNGRRGYPVIIRMKPNTKCEIPTPPDDKPKDRVSFWKMIWGKIWCRARKGSEFEVHVPRAVAGVRGTEFTVSHDEGGSAVAVFEGAVDVTADAGNASLQPGQAATVGDGGAVQTTTVGPEQNWGREGEWSTVIAEQFDALDESRWEKWGMYSGSAEGVSVMGGRLVLSDEGGGGFNPCGITTREKALRWPVGDAMVVELRAQASELSEHADMNAGIVAGTPIEEDWQRAWNPWDVWGPVLKMTRGGVGVWLYMPGREKVLSAEASQAPGGARMIIQRAGKEGEGTVTLTDLQGTVLGTYEGRLGSEFNAGGLWYANVWGYAYPEGKALEATVDSVWMGPLSRLGESPVVEPGAPPTTPAAGAAGFAEDFGSLDPMTWLTCSGQATTRDGNLLLAGANAGLVTISSVATVPADDDLMLELKRPESAGTTAIGLVPDLGFLAAGTAQPWWLASSLALKWSPIGIEVVSPASGRTLAGPIPAPGVGAVRLVIGHRAIPGQLVLRVLGEDGAVLGAGVVEAGAIVTGSRWHIALWRGLEDGASGIDAIWVGPAAGR